MVLLEKKPVLLAAFRRGERYALEEVYRAYVDDVTMLVKRGFVHDREKLFTVRGLNGQSDQFDIVQETFLKAFSQKARMSYDDGSPFRPYLLRIAKNLMIDRHRNSRRVVDLDRRGNDNSVGNVDSILERNLPFEPENPAIEAHRTRQQAAVVDFVSSLSRNERAFYDVRYEEALGQEKAARKLGVTRRRVRTLEGRLCKGLKKHLKGRGLWP